MQEGVTINLGKGILKIQEGVNLKSGKKNPSNEGGTNLKWEMRLFKLGSDTV